MLVINFSQRVKPNCTEKNDINNQRKLLLSYDMSQIGQIRLTNFARQRAFSPKTQSVKFYKKLTNQVFLQVVTNQRRHITQGDAADELHHKNKIN